MLKAIWHICILNTPQVDIPRMVDCYALYHPQGIRDEKVWSQKVIIGSRRFLSCPIFFFVLGNCRGSGQANHKWIQHIQQNQLYYAETSPTAKYVKSCDGILGIFSWLLYVMDY